MVASTTLMLKLLLMATTSHCASKHICWQNWPFKHRHGTVRLLTDLKNKIKKKEFSTFIIGPGCPGL